MILRDQAFSGFSVNDIPRAKDFYTRVLKLDVADAMGGAIELQIGGGKHVYVYGKDDHVPATFTVLNFPTDDIDAAVAELRQKGVKFEQYEGMTDDKAIARGIETGMGPSIAWFKDPAGNVLSVLQNPAAR